MKVLNTPTVLFVDDDQDFEFLIRQKFRKKLKSGEFNFEFAQNGEEALKKLAANPDIHLVFTDLNMPVMDGLTFLNRLRETERDLTKSVVVSAFGEMDNIRKAMNFGAFDFLIKPIDFEDLTITLEKALKEIEELEAGMQARRELRQALLEKAAAEESERIKQRFFANITHEFRTPLTLILGPIEQLLEHPDPEEVRNGLKIVRRNANQLLRLINQLLDFARIDAGKMQLSLVQDDVSGFVSSVVEGFQSAAAKKKINLSFSGPKNGITADFDADKLQQILNNVLSNAHKFTPEGKSISVVVSEQADNIKIEVIDEAGGIPKDLLPFIFDRFYRVRQEFTEHKSGTGIGLAYARELARLHGGSLKAESEEGVGSTLTLEWPRLIVEAEGAELPGLNEADFSNGLVTDPAEWAPDREEVPVQEDVDDEEDRTVVLIVEDNPEIRAYIKKVLADDFRLMEAADGKSGLELALKNVPDIVVSDVMMPVMDGFEMCKTLKSNEQTSHVPVILLTAKTGAEARVEGLHTGADDYLEKPFNHHELKARIQNLVKSRRDLSERYRREALETPADIEVESMESAFLRRIRETLEAELANEFFGVEDLAAAVGMSRTQLHRKITALTGESAGKFMRTFRLKTAHQLLEKHSGNVSEIAYQVGFSSPSYFTKCFREEYGYSPKEVKSR